MAETCKYAGKEYSEGSLICKNGREMKCRGGDWEETGYACNKSDGEEISETQQRDSLRPDSAKEGERSQPD